MRGDQNIIHGPERMIRRQPPIGEQLNHDRAFQRRGRRQAAAVEKLHVVQRAIDRNRGFRGCLDGFNFSRLLSRNGRRCR